MMNARHRAWRPEAQARALSAWLAAQLALTRLQR